MCEGDGGAVEELRCQPALLITTVADGSAWKRTNNIKNRGHGNQFPHNCYQHMKREENTVRKFCSIALKLCICIEVKICKKGQKV